MRGLIHGVWHDIERWPEAEAWLGRQIYTLIDDPEAGSFEATEFDAIQGEA